MLFHRKPTRKLAKFSPTINSRWSRNNSERNSRLHISKKREEEKMKRYSRYFYFSWREKLERRIRGYWMEERKGKERCFASKTAPYVRESIFAGFVLGKLDERTDYRVNKAWNRIAQRSFLIFPSVQQFPISPHFLLANLSPLSSWRLFVARITESRVLRIVLNRDSSGRKQTRKTEFSVARLFEPCVHETLIPVSKKKLQSVGVNLDPLNDGPSKFQRLKRGLLKKRYTY